jgi:hypothetical protein
MTTTSHWTLHYAILVLVALFAGPFLGKLQAVESLPVTVFGLTASQTVRLAVEAIGLGLLCLFSIRTFLQMPDTGRGCSFIRRLILPVTGLFTLIAMDKTLQAVGLSVIDRVGSQQYAIAYTTALILTALWTTVVWLINRDSLERFFSSPAPKVDRAASASVDEDTGETEPDAHSGDTEGQRRPAEHPGAIPSPQRIGAGSDGGGVFGERSDDSTICCHQNDATQ